MKVIPIAGRLSHSPKRQGRALISRHSLAIEPIASALQPTVCSAQSRG